MRFEARTQSRGKRFVSLVVGITVGLALALAPARVSAGSLLEDVAGVTLDPLKLGEGSRNVRAAAERISDSLDRTILQLSKLQTETDLDIRDYLDEVESIVNTINRTIRVGGDRLERIVKTLSESALELEARVHRHAVDLIWRAQCAVEVITTDTVQRALAEALSSIRQAEPTYEVFGIPTGKIKISPVDVRDPDIVYGAIKEKRLDELHGKLSGKDKAHIIRSTYMNLARLARLTRCHYLGLDAEIIFVREVLEYERLVRPWNRVVASGLLSTNETPENE